MPSLSLTQLKIIALFCAISGVVLMLEFQPKEPPLIPVSRLGPTHRYAEVQLRGRAQQRPMRSHASAPYKFNLAQGADSVVIYQWKAFPEIQSNDLVRITGRISHYRGELQIRAQTVEVLDD